MMTALDGKIIGKFLDTEEGQSLFSDYVAIQENYEPQAWICGRTTMEESFAFGEKIEFLDDGKREIPREDYYVNTDADRYMIALDSKGKLRWNENMVPVSDQLKVSSHIVIILSENVSDDYLRYLQDLGISYIFGGKDQINLSLVMKKIKTKLSVETMMVDGGGVLNGSFLAENLIDEVSIVLVPAADGHPETPSLFIQPTKEIKDASRFLLESVEKMAHNGVYLKYKTRR